MSDELTDAVDAAPPPRVLREDPSKYRRSRRIELCGLTGLSTVFGGMVSTTPLWPAGLVFVAVGVGSFLIAYPIRWRADPPSVTIDATGITLRSTNLGITFKDRAYFRHLAWGDIDTVEISGRGRDSAGYIHIAVQPTRSELGSTLTFSVGEMVATESDVTDALDAFAPERLQSLTGRLSVHEPPRRRQLPKPVQDQPEIDR
jgi:hypothetical protein